MAIAAGAASYEGERRIRQGECKPRPPAPGEAQLRVSHFGICATNLQKPRLRHRH